MTGETLVVVFGASGRVGARLLPLLTVEPVTVMALARRDKPHTVPPDVHWMRLDVTNRSEWPQSLDAISDIASSHRRIVLVDVLLDRATVIRMRTSIMAVTAYILCLHERLNTSNQPCSLIAASTTAVLSPWFYQTPYGLAKRRQLASYAADGLPGAAYLLPALVHNRADMATRVGLTWAYTDAIRYLAAESASHGTARPERFRLFAPYASQHEPAGRKQGPAVESARATINLLSSQLALILGPNNSPQAHREASHYRLAATPTWLRRDVDHHAVPPMLIRRLGRSLAVPVEILPAVPPGNTGTGPSSAEGEDRPAELSRTEARRDC